MAAPLTACQQSWQLPVSYISYTSPYSSLPGGGSSIPVLSLRILHRDSATEWRKDDHLIKYLDGAGYP